MTDSPEALPVIFRAEWNDSPKTGNLHITAVFPTLQGTGPQDATCYAHVGQHSACSRRWYNETRAAKPDEYADLLAELRSVYEEGADAVKLVVAKRWTKHHDKARRS